MNVAESDLHLRVLVAQRQQMAGDVAAALGGCIGVWEELGADDWWLRMLVAHLVADMCPDAEQSLAWDLLSLYAASSAMSEPHTSARPRHSRYCAVSMSSIYLSLGQGYRRTGRDVESRACLELARMHERDVPAGRYRDGLGAGIAQLARKLGSGDRARLGIG